MPKQQRDDNLQMTKKLPNSNSFSKCIRGTSTVPPGEGRKRRKWVKEKGGRAGRGGGEGETGNNRFSTKETGVLREMG